MKKNKQKDEFLHSDNKEVDMLIDEIGEGKDELNQQKEGKHGLKRKKSEKKIPREGLGEKLMEVYESTGEEVELPSLLTQRKRSWQRILIFIMIFLLAVFACVAGISWFLYGQGSANQEGNLVFSIEAPVELRSGDEVIYSVHYKNEDTVNVADAELNLRYPAGFIFESASLLPDNEENNKWTLGILKPGKDDIIEIKGFLVGKPDTTATISGSLRYLPANFSSPFNELATAQITLMPVQVDVRFEGADEILVGQDTTYSIIYRNDSDKDLSNLRFEIVYPSNFVVTDFNTKPTDQDTIWDIPALPPDEETEIQIDGHFSSSLSDEKAKFDLRLQQKGGRDEYYDQVTYSKETAVIAGDLLLTTIANGISEGVSSIDLGDVLNVSISYENKNQASFKDITLTTVLETRYKTESAASESKGALDFTSLVDSNEGKVKTLTSNNDKVLEAKSITWSPEDLASLKELASFDSDEINVQIPVLQLSELKKIIKHPEDVQIVVRTTAKVSEVGDIKEPLEVNGSEIVFSLNTDLALDAFAQYFDESGNPIGEGPLPPVVGEKTTYQVVWTLTNSLHEANDIIVSTQLPSNVSWTNQFSVSAGEVDFKASNNLLNWRLNRMPLDVNTVTLKFSVEVRPSSSQLGQVANLTDRTTLTAKDGVTGGKVVQNISPVTTGVERDSRASNKGVVSQ